MIENETHQHTEISLGSSPRGSLSLYRTGQARAAMMDRDFVLQDDIKVLAVTALAHRLVLSPGARLRNLSPEDPLSQILREVPVPSAVQVGTRPAGID
ncbi:MAG: hypothetical protein KAT23_08005 [Anaerolineales bacterium]|nr:hypothetical protein [Anaerolineales bacterium]